MATTRGRKKKTEITEANAILNSVKDLDINKVVSDVSSLQINVQNTLAALSAELTNKLQQMDQVEIAINLKQNHLKELFDIEKELLNIEEIKMMREQEEKEAEEKDKERNRIWQEQDQDRAKAWLREKEQHDYKVQFERQREKDEFQSQLAQVKRNESIRQEALNKSWKEREDVLKSKENEFNDLKDKVSNFDKVIANEIDKAKKQVEETLTKDHQYLMNTLKSQAESELRLRDQKISAQELTMDNLRKQLSELSVHLENARRDAKEVANQALQSASGRQVVEALQKVVSDRDSSTKSK